MSKLYFYYSSMNAGKSTTLLQASYNYQERGMQTLVLCPELDDRDGSAQVVSRIGISADAVTFNPTDDMYSLVEKLHENCHRDCVLIDEAQFLTRQQVKQISDVADALNIPVLCYGLRTDFQGNLFEGSEQLLAWADTITEIKTICHCGRKATMVLRLDEKGNVIKQGAQIKIGGNDQYTSVCRLHFKKAMAARRPDELMLNGFEDVEVTS